MIPYVFKVIFHGSFNGRPQSFDCGKASKAVSDRDRNRRSAASMGPPSFDCRKQPGQQTVSTDCARDVESFNGAAVFLTAETWPLVAARH